MAVESTPGDDFVFFQPMTSCRERCKSCSNGNRFWQTYDQEGCRSSVLQVETLVNLFICRFC